MATVDTSAPDAPSAPPMCRHELRNGDHMTADEFQALYEQMPEDFSAELIGGIVYVMMSPLKREHGRKHNALGALLFLYESRTPGVESGDNATLRLGGSGTPQPDAFLRIDQSCGGQSKISKDDYVVGAPEFVAEVAQSSRAIDLGAKKNDYARYGVQEYVVVCLGDEPEVRWFDLPNDQPLTPDAAGVIKLRQFPGLWIDTAALLAHDQPKLLATLEAGLNSSEHAAFVKQLDAMRPSS